MSKADFFFPLRTGFYNLQFQVYILTILRKKSEWKKCLRGKSQNCEIKSHNYLFILYSVAETIFHISFMFSSTVCSRNLHDACFISCLHYTWPSLTSFLLVQTLSEQVFGAKSKRMNLKELCLLLFLQSVNGAIVCGLRVIQIMSCSCMAKSQDQVWRFYLTDLPGWWW